ncbi:MAG TPA: LysR family transcriptional regulator [Xanthomonadaceae bacterium]|nr:LysR family transcriptional regulator [Xanthomonadaceae bacterium]
MTGAPLSAVSAFACVARHASFSRAAAELGVSPSALSQTVRSLESQLGLRLLHRTTRRVGLTEHGERFLQRVAPGLAQIDAAFEDLDALRDRPTGRLRINLPRIVAERLVLPRLGDFMARYPEVHVELYHEGGFADLVAGGFDAGIRLGESLARDMVALPISPRMRQVVVGAPSYFARHPVPNTPQDLIGHDCIGFRKASGRLYAWEFTDPRRLAGKRDFDIQVEGRLIFNDSSLARLAALDGLGLAQLFEWEIVEDVADGRLQRVLDDWLQPFDGWYIYYPAREQMAPKLRVFIDFLREPG